MARRNKNSIHYVNNAEFFEAMVKYKESVAAAEAAGEEKPRVPEYIGECFVKIANHLAYKSNFRNYSFREEMILDAIENCITYIDNFNPEKSRNPFAYFTQFAYYAFLRRISKEKKYLHTKYKYIRNVDIGQIISENPDGSEFSNEFINYLRKQLDESDVVLIGEEEEKEKKNKMPKRRPKYFDKKDDSSLDI